MTDFSRFRKAVKENFPSLNRSYIKTKNKIDKIANSKFETKTEKKDDQQKLILD